MGILTTWIRTSSPLVKALMAISITSALVVVHKTVYVPYVKRERLRKNEAWANMIMEQEDLMEQSEGGYNSY